MTYKEWKKVYDWAVENGYRFHWPGQRGSDSGREELSDTAINNKHPVVKITWYDMIRWCNAKSEKENRTPVYYTNDDLTDVFREFQHDVTNNQVLWDADGYRLPTEAEWEKAARGGLNGKRFAWGNESIDSMRANYNRNEEGTTPVGMYPPNGYGIYDAAGNVWEAVWDWRDPDWYRSTAAREPDTRGPFSVRHLKGTSYRVLRGGGWNSDEVDCRVAARSWWPPYFESAYVGFRLVRGNGED